MLNVKYFIFPVLFDCARAHGIPLLLYYSIIFIAWIVYSPRILDVDIYLVPSWAYSWGLIGSVLQGLWFVSENIWKKSLRKCWFVWFLILPLFGAISGALTYLIFQAGLIASTGDVTLQSDVFPMLLSALAGFGSKRVVGTFSELVGKIGIKS